jgi:hypothetical protein
MMSGAQHRTSYSLLVESNRRLLVNGILWAAGIEVPDGGVQCEIPEHVMK